MDLLHDAELVRCRDQMQDTAEKKGTEKKGTAEKKGTVLVIEV